LPYSDIKSIGAEIKGAGLNTYLQFWQLLKKFLKTINKFALLLQFSKSRLVYLSFCLT